jgi:hypothetical protein
MRLRALCCNLAWFASQTPAFRRFRRALEEPTRTQEAVLGQILRANRRCAFGRKHDFAIIRTIREFQERVPLSSYEDYTAGLDRIRAGEPGVLTDAAVRRLVPTSGSNAAAKLVPYTTALQREFAAAIGPWVCDLFRSDPDLMAGPAFWSITPQILPLNLESAVPIGFDEDTTYLGGLWKPLVDATLAVPASVGGITEVTAFRSATLLHLLQAAELRLISVWHPSFLSLLLEHMEVHWEELVGQVPEPCRRAALRACGPRNMSAIWPRLKLISCWAEGPATLAASRLRQTFPHVRLQPKGLLATEAFVTIPFAEAHPPALRSHFFEFLDRSNRPHLAEDLSVGSDYSVAVTTGGGFYRYRLGDRVRVVGRIGQTVSLEFIGREAGVVDLFGEKLNEQFVARALSAALAKCSLEVKFAMVVPETAAGGAGRYTVFLECAREWPEGLALDLERRFRGNPHYALCVSLGQLRPLVVERVKPGAFERYLAWCSHKGMRVGNVKPRLLCAEASVPEVLRGTHLLSQGSLIP